METLTVKMLDVRKQMQTAFLDLDKQGRPFHKFTLGTLCWTAGVNDSMAESVKFAAFVFASLQRHCNCDWGDLCDSDKHLNDQALSLKNPGRLFSKYILEETTPIYIITEWDRSVTTILFPEEY